MNSDIEVLNVLDIVIEIERRWEDDVTANKLVEVRAYVVKLVEENKRLRAEVNNG